MSWIAGREQVRARGTPRAGRAEPVRPSLALARGPSPASCFQWRQTRGLREPGCGKKPQAPHPEEGALVGGARDAGAGGKAGRLEGDGCSYEWQCDTVRGEGCRCGVTVCAV